MKFKTYIMEDAIEEIIDYRGKTPKKSDSGIPTLSAKSVKNNHIDYSSCYYISPDEYKRFMVRGFPKIGDVLLTTEAPMGVVARLDRDDVAIAQRLLTLRGKENVLDNEYLLYFLQSSSGQSLLRARETGTTVTGIKQAEFRKIQINIPEISIQKKIGRFLRVLDEKVEINNKINENLAYQAQAIYQQLFVTEANPDWPLGHLSDLIDIKYGKDHKKLADGTYPVYGSGGIMRYVERPLYEKESVLIPRKGTLNNVMYVNQPFWSVDTMFYTEMKQANIAKFVYHYVKSKDLVSMNAGSAVPSMTTAILNAMELKIPSEEVLLQFENSIAPMYEMIKKNEEQSRKLAALRDTLLPKLMSGEIDVSNLDL
ncbi:restriction endonuclease subunit S [Clostridium fessum]|uniref:restriction endonuclease subunit S n=1 Tax=Clostridium fessum TaxID=2126740 RepID=UPI0022E54663|nr:restriction endonuclease subunit S [Clostridium fessum]